jgi:acetate kinase
VLDRVLALNVGSSSLKWSLFDARATDRGAEAPVDDGDAAFDASAEKSGDEALAVIASRVGAVDVVAHRIVHGGERFRAPAVIDDGVRRELEALVPLAPLHMRPALAVLDAARERWDRAAHVAAFDTAFHATLPREASTYAVRREWREHRGFRRYGFHGLSVSYAVSRVEAVAGRPVSRLLVLHLGSGASATAVLDGRSVDTTMGMTPLEGIVMGTRSGSVDPGALVQMLASGVTAEELGDGLEREGGLLALCGQRDMRAIARSAAAGDERAQFARAHFVRSAAKHACGLLPALGGLDAVVFTGGIGEHDAGVRAGVAAALEMVGVVLDAERNAATSTEDRVVSRTSSRVVVLVVHAREDISLLRAARQASCSLGAGKELEHAPPEENSGRDRFQ